RDSRTPGKRDTASAGPSIQSLHIFSLRKLGAIQHSMTTKEPVPRCPTSVQEPLVGIDVGGSKILGGLVSRLGEVVFEHQVPTRPQHLLEDLVDVAKVIVERANSRARSIGVGMTGYIDRTNGVLVRSMNMGVGGIPIARALADATRLSVHVENDVHA